MPTSTKKYYTLADLAERWGVSHGTVLTHVYTGDLRAIDVGTNFPKGKSRFLVPAEALEAFETARATPPPEKPLPRKRVRVRCGEVIEFFT
jgi:hypothetical protein